VGSWESLRILRIDGAIQRGWPIQPRFWLEWGRSRCTPPRAETSAHSPTLFPTPGSPVRFLYPFSLTFLVDIEQWVFIADKRKITRGGKSFGLKILPITPLNSKILMLSPVQLHCFHRPRGRGYPRIAQPLLGRNSTIPFHRRSVSRQQRHSGALLASVATNQLRPRGAEIPL
jgi:hypothetical protein